MKLPRNVTVFTDRHGTIRYRFRKTGLPAHYFKHEPGTEGFEEELDRCRLGLFDSPKRPSRPAPSLAPPLAGEPHVYFVGAKAGPIKIGVSVNIAQRLKKLRTGNHMPIRLLAFVPGGEAVEAEYHARFAHLRQVGEWFKRAPEIMSEIRDLANRLAKNELAIPARRCND